MPSVSQIPSVRVDIVANDQTQAAITSATSKLKSFGSAGESAGKSLERNFHEARGAAALFGEEAGVKLNRHLQSVLASSAILGPVLEAAFPIAAAVGLGEVLAQIGEKLLSFSDKMLGLARNTEQVTKKITQLDAEIIKGLRDKFQLQDAYNTLVLGLKGGDAERARLGNLKQERDLLDELLISETKRAQIQAGSLTTKGFLGIAIGGQLGQFLLSKDLKESAEVAKKMEESLAPLVNRITDLNAEVKTTPWKAFREDTEKAKEETKKLNDELTKTLEKVQKGVANLHILSTGQRGLQLNNPEAQRPSTTSLQSFGITSPLFPLFATPKELDIAKQYGFVMTDIVTKTKELSAVQKTVSDAISQGFDNAFQDIALGTRTIGQAFQSLASSVAAEVLKMVAKLLILPPLLQAINALLGAVGLGGGFASKGSITIPGAQLSNVPLFGGGHAMGGGVTPSMSYLVGERGPERFTPSVSGTISPASTSIQVNVINNSSQPVTAKASSRFDGKSYVTSVFLEDLKTNGPMRQALIASR